jgi:hypothetical protein
VLAALCEKVLGVITMLTPGHFRMRGMFLTEMYGTDMYIGRRAFETGEITAAEFLKRQVILTTGASP